MKFVHGLMIALMLSMVAYVVNREMVRPDFQSAIRAKSGLSAGFVQAAYAEEAATKMDWRIHTPPPPPNQIVQVKMTSAKKVKMSFWDPIWIEGKLQIQTIKSPYGDVGFQLSGVSIEPYKD